MFIIKTERNWLIDLALLTILLLFFYLLGLGAYPLFTPDEGRYTEVAREMLVTGDYITPRVNGVVFLDKPILYYWLQAIALQLFGANEWAARFSPAMLGIFGVLFTYVCGRKLYDRRTGLFAAIVLATSPLYFGGAHYANLDLEVAVWISAAMLCFITAVQPLLLNKPTANQRFLFAAYGFAALAFLTKGLIGLVFPAMVAGCWLLLMGRLHFLTKLRVLSGLLLFIVIVLPWYLLAQQANPEFLHYFFVGQQFERFLSANDFNNKTVVWFYLPVILIGFFPWTVFLCQAFNQAIRSVWQDKQQHAITCFLLLWAVLIFIFFSLPRSKLIGYILPVLPALALLVGRYLALLSTQPAIQKTAISLSVSPWVGRITRASVIFMLLAIAFAALLIAAAYYQWVDFLPGFIPYLWGMAAIFFLGGMGALFIWRKKTIMPLFILSATTSAAALWVLTFGASYLNTKSTKALAQQLQSILQPQDEVINYFSFYQDAPFYLQRQITLVADWHASQVTRRDNWIRELSHSKVFQQPDTWLISEAVFWQRWESNRRVFVLMKVNDLPQFKRQAKYFFTIGQANNIILVTNQK
ncbi:MAG TPA: glycosyltransferase family 39 protein [Gammaproteobacteria bacterium]|nr:glycosyltransferase family 39 protein [Gammaproteobacteria bacterium]